MVDCTGLENRQGCKPLVGSNPTPSAIYLMISMPYKAINFYPNIRPIIPKTLDFIASGCFERRKT